MLSLRKLLSDLRLILILPDRDRDTVMSAHALRPRFLTYADGNLDDIAAVLRKMLGPKAAPARLRRRQEKEMTSVKAGKHRSIPGEQEK